MTLAQHTSKSQEHYTPSFILEPARKLMGGIDLDPASSDIANERVKAEFYLDKESDGLDSRWNIEYLCDHRKDRPSRIFLNPPGGKAPGIPSLQKAFWNKLIGEYQAGRVEQAIFLAFSIELLQTSQNGQDDPAFWCTSYPFCIPSKRISYINQDGNPQKSPPNASAIIYLPPKTRSGVELTDKFSALFSNIGAVVIPIS
jgi:hypothetical protein